MATRHPTIAIAITASLLVATACGSSTSSTSSEAASNPPAAASSAPATSTAPVAVVDWNGFHGDATRSGVGIGGPIGRPVLNWQFHATAAVPNDIAIVGDQVSFAGDDGTVYALDRVTGTQRWTTKVDAAPLTGPVAAGGHLYFTNGAGAVIALDANDGHTTWTSAATYDGPSQLVKDGGSLYLGTGDGFLVALDAATGAEQWKLQPTPGTDSLHSPAAMNGFVYVGTTGKLVAVDAAKHEVAWIGDVAGQGTGTASVANGLAFIGVGPDATSGTLHAFDARTGEPRWTAAVSGLQFPTISDGVVFSASVEGVVAAIDSASGATRWTIQRSGTVRPMALADGVLYLAADEEHRVYAVDPTTGGTFWQYDVDELNDCCLAVTGGAVYAATMDGSVYSIGGDGTTLAAQAPETAGPAPTASATALAPLADLPVTVAWTTDLQEMGFDPISQIAIHPKTGQIWAPEARTDRIAILDADGTVLEQWGESGTGPGQFNFMGPNGGYGTLAFDKDGSFFVLDVGNRRIQHFDAKRKLVGSWGSFGTDPGHFSNPVGIAVGDDGSVWVLDDRRSIVEHYDPTGKVLGSFDPFADTPDNDGANSLAIDTAGNLYVTTVAPTHVSVFDPTGRLIRTVGDGVFTEQATDLAIDPTGRIFVTQGPERGERPGVLVFDADGSPLGGFGPIGLGEGEFVFPAGIALDGKGGLYVEDSLPESARLAKLALPKDLR